MARLVNDAIAASRVLELKYYKENEDQFTDRSVEPYRLRERHARAGTSSATT